MPASPGVIRVAGLAVVCGLGLGFLAGRFTAPVPPPVIIEPPPPLTPDKPAPPPQAVFAPVAFTDLPGWADDDVSAVWPAFNRSCSVFAKKMLTDMIGSGDLARPASSWQAVCAELATLEPKTPDAFRAAVERLLVPYSVAATKPDGALPDPNGIFTGYYESELNGSLTRSEKFNVPIYGIPRTLITANVKDFLPPDTQVPGGIPPALVGRVDAGRLKPFYTREEIDAAGAIADDADVVVWADDPVAVHILHIQGSGRVTLPDGQVLRIGFAGHNGHRFRGIGGVLTEAGVLPRGQGSMNAVRDWLTQHPAEAAAYMNRNARYIFFRPLAASETEDGPVGALGLSLAPGRSLAVDPRHVPLGAPLWLEADDPDGQSLRRLMVAQDTGAAITGVVRGDFFWGHGEAAFQKAGRMRSPGRYYILVPKP